MGNTDQKKFKKSPHLEESEISSLREREDEIQERIKQLEDFVEYGPERERLAEEDRLSTLPAPAEVKEKQREKQFLDKLSRGELKNEKRHQAKSGILIFLLIIATISVALWIYKIVELYNILTQSNMHICRVKLIHTLILQLNQLSVEFKVRTSDYFIV